MRPRLTDDGRTVELDLHGVRVDEAMEIVRRTVSLAAHRGRATVRVIHGASTSDPYRQNRTIQHELHRLLDVRALGSVTSDARMDGHTVLGLTVTAGRTDGAPLRLADVL